MENPVFCTISIAAVEKGDGNYWIVLSWVLRFGGPAEVDINVRLSVAVVWDLSLTANP